MIKTNFTKDELIISYTTLNFSTIKLDLSIWLITNNCSSKNYSLKIQI